MFLEHFAPKQFLCRYPLSIGALCASALMIFVTLASSFALLAQLMKFDSCIVCPRYVWRNSYGFSVTAMLYCVIMLATHLWLIAGVKYKKSSIVLSWVVITGMWLALTLCLLVVLICMYSTEINFVSWLLCLLFGFAAMGILLYTVLVVYGFWLELKAEEHDSQNPP